MPSGPPALTIHLSAVSMYVHSEAFFLPLLGYTSVDTPVAGSTHQQFTSEFTADPFMGEAHCTRAKVPFGVHWGVYSSPE